MIELMIRFSILFSIRIFYSVSFLFSFFSFFSFFFFFLHFKCSQRIAFALLEKKLPFEVVKIPWRLPRPDWYLGVNPKGALPYLRYKNEFYDDWQKIFVLLDSWEPKLTGVDTNRWLAQAESDFAAAWREYLTVCKEIRKKCNFKFGFAVF